LFKSLSRKHSSKWSTDRHMSSRPWINLLCLLRISFFALVEKSVKGWEAFCYVNERLLKVTILRTLIWLEVIGHVVSLDQSEPYVKITTIEQLTLANYQLANESKKEKLLA